MERRFQRESFAPIKVGEEIDLKIEAVGSKGDGIGKVKGFVIFVPGTKEGDTIKVKITKVFRKVAFAEAVSEGSSDQKEASKETEKSDDAEEESYEEGEDY